MSGLKTTEAELRQDLDSQTWRVKNEPSREIRAMLDALEAHRIQRELGALCDDGAIASTPDGAYVLMCVRHALDGTP